MLLLLVLWCDEIRVYVVRWADFSFEQVSSVLLCDQPSIYYNWIESRLQSGLLPVIMIKFTQFGGKMHI